jgi:hypothetical protein
LNSDDTRKDHPLSGTSTDIVPMPPSVDPGPDDVLGPGHTYETVTRKISDVVFMPLSRTPRQFFIGFAYRSWWRTLLLLAVGWLFLRGVGRLGN